MNYWLSLFVLLSMLPVSANAYVCSRVTTISNGPDTGPSLSWFSRIIPISINEDGTSQLDADQEFQVVEAYRVWERLESDSDTCPGAAVALQIYDLTLVPPARFNTSSRSIGYNYPHLIQTRTLWYSGTKTGPTPSLQGSSLSPPQRISLRTAELSMRISNSMPPISNLQVSRTPTATAQRPI